MRGLADMCNCGCSVDCETCLPKGFICIPRGDRSIVVFSVRENNCHGEWFDISGAAEIVFAVADNLGGTVRIVKKLSLAEIAISSNNYQFSVDISSSDTDTLVNTTNYYECRVTSAAGAEKTVSAGVFKSPNTMIKDI